METLDLHPGPFRLPTPDEWELWLLQQELDDERRRLVALDERLRRREVDVAARERVDVAARERAAADAAAGQVATRAGCPSKGDATADLAATHLAVAVQALGSFAPGELPGETALEQARATQRAIADLTVIGLAQLADVEDRRLHALEQAPSTSVWAQRLGTDVPRGQVALAKRLTRHAGVHAALRTGGLTLAAAQAVGQVLTRLERFLDTPDGLLDGHQQEPALHAVLTSGIRQLVCRSRGGWTADLETPGSDAALASLVAELEGIADAAAPALQRLEAGLLVLAREVPAEQLRSLLAVVVAALLPQQLEKAALAGRDRRALELHRLEDGSGWTLRGHLDLLTGELLFTVLHAQLATDVDNPTDTAAARDLRQQGLDPHDADVRTDVRAAAGHGAVLPRSMAERLHDALRVSLRRHLDSALAGTRGKARPHLSVLVPLGALQAQPGTLPVETSAGTRLPGSLLGHLWPDSAVTRFVLGLKGTVLGASHTQRTATRLERLVKHIETGGWCETAGCVHHTGRLGVHLHPHHLDPWALSGTTQLATSALLCRGDHRVLHDGAELQLRNGRRAGPHGWTPGPGPHDGWPDLDELDDPGRAPPF